MTSDGIAVVASSETKPVPANLSMFHRDLYKMSTEEDSNAVQLIERPDEELTDGQACLACCGVCALCVTCLPCEIFYVVVNCLLCPFQYCFALCGLGVAAAA
ncbi:hypothetical protein POM88_034999 [Heracleum sosnowskyi]|uniref:Uncharacterized protein n=1 Tax=Heracleum sosnowskyi TaxID=360622 RepID=A0AAD8HMH8_9APIA|nr:hypothetical protein POM88_034999 [Heracleum sosnowskyi]